MSKIKINRTKQKEARKYFGVLGNKEYDLHHKDENLIFTDPQRYNEWRIEDLVVLTHSEHSRLHSCSKNENWGKAPKGERNGANTHPEKNCFVNGSCSKMWKGTHYYNNGVKEIRCKECPEGYQKGRLPGCFGR